MACLDAWRRSGARVDLCGLWRVKRRGRDPVEREGVHHRTRASGSRRSMRRDHASFLGRN
jgi:hypothetical protein